MKEERNDLLTVGEIAEILGVNKNTILHYDRKGLISSTRSDNNYRYYHKKQINTFREILSLRKIGFSIEKIKSIKKSIVSCDYDVVLKMIEQRTAEYKKEIEEIQRNIKVLGSYQKYMEYQNDLVFFNHECVCDNDEIDTHSYNIFKGEDEFFCVKNFDEEVYTVLELENLKKSEQRLMEKELKKCFFGYTISEKNLKDFDYKYSEFIVKKEIKSCPNKYTFPKGAYAVFYIKEGLSNEEKIKKFLQKIEENGYRTCGDMFVEKVSLFDKLTEGEPEIKILKIMVKSLTSE